MLRSALYYSLQIFKAVVAVHLTKINQNINKRCGGMLYVSSRKTDNYSMCITSHTLGRWVSATTGDLFNVLSARKILLNGKYFVFYFTRLEQKCGDFQISQERIFYL